MREYYGELNGNFEYIEDKNHKFIPWKDYKFSFELHNSTNYTLVLERKYYIFATVGPKETIQIQVDGWGDGEIFVYAKEDQNLKCNFDIECGCMIKRNLVEYMEYKLYIAPIFRNSIITIVTCEDCSPNFETKSEYNIIPLEKPGKMIKFCNYTPYDLIISTENTVVQIIESNKERNEKCSSNFVGIPLNGIIYIDTLFEEIVWKDSRSVYEDAILRVNGCYIKINNGTCSEYVTVIGPALSEPYIRHLYASFGKSLVCEGDINIWCNKIDYRLE